MRALAESSIEKVSGWVIDSEAGALRLGGPGGPAETAGLGYSRPLAAQLQAVLCSVIVPLCSALTCGEFSLTCTLTYAHITYGFHHQR